MAAIGKARLSTEEKRANLAHRRLINKTKGAIVKTKTTKVPAKPGTKPGSKILRKVVKGVQSLHNKAIIKPKRMPPAKVIH